jgi:putative DNA primase/helicase
MTARLDIPTVNAMLADRMADLARELVGAEPTQRTRDAWRFYPRGGLSVVIAGPKRGAWHDHGAGKGGDPVGLVAHLRAIPMREALAWALAWLGEAPGKLARPAPRPAVAASTAQHEPVPSRTMDLARAIWREAVAPSGTLAETYLAARGLALPPDAPLRFHPACPRGAERWPAMLALMTDPATAQPCGVHRIFLAHDGMGKAPGNAKMMAGNAGVIRLMPDDEVTTGLGIAEGIETALAVMQRAGWAPVWAATSAGAIRGFPVLPGIEALTVFADMDGPGLEAARACCRAWAAAGREARLLAPPAGDWDDVLPRGERAA